MRIHRLRSCWRLRAGRCTMISGRSTQTCTHTHSNTRTHAHIHTYTHTHRHPCTHTHTCIYSSYIRIIHMYYIYTYIPSKFAHGGNQTWNIWISRSTRFQGRSLEWRELRLLTWKLLWNYGDSRENVFYMYEDSRENFLKILAVVIISSPISSVRA